jgi:hypothetical protein
MSNPSVQGTFYQCDSGGSAVTSADVMFVAVPLPCRCGAAGCGGGGVADVKDR